MYHRSMVNKTAHVNVHKHADTEHAVYTEFTVVLTHGACASQPVHLVLYAHNNTYRLISSTQDVQICR